ncbi:uncharacterized protein LOC116431744 [Nomia melanderi]|uniref:uncharacterized protein LOC116431744 n=1 Tax=Nomia melanderi TaxID=2448451 RepID=UPI003FCE28B7
MSVSSKVFYKKIKDLHPELSSSVLPEILDKYCQHPLAQPFLKWFNENVNFINILSNEELQIKNKLQESNEWLDNLELDCALEKVTKSCPDLLKIASFDDTDISDLFAEFEIVKNAYIVDDDYILVLQSGIGNLKKLVAEVDEEIKKESEWLNVERIATDKAYEDCVAILGDFDENNHEFFHEVECLLNLYADAAENKGIPSVWTQMPLELFCNNVKLYNNYLGVYVKKQFDNVSEQEQEKDSNYASLISNSQEVQIDNEKLQELTLCKANLINVKIEEILAKIQAESNIAMLEYVQSMYNNGNLKIPKLNELRTEILMLSTKRDFLEESVSLQEGQLSEIIQQFAELQITKILEQDACLKLEHRNDKLKKIKNLQFLTQKCGHTDINLLYILMQIQLHSLTDVLEFVTDTNHYLTTEYLLNYARCESMEQQQEEYSMLISSAPDTFNLFNKLLVSMLCNSDNVHQLNSALDKYNELINENKNKKQFILETDINSKIDKLEMLEKEINVIYTSEIQRGPTYSFKPISYEIETSYKEVFDHLQRIQTDLTKIRNQMKEQMKTSMGFERERNLLWQRFLVDPGTLKRIYKEAEQLTNKSCFGNTFENE